MIQAIIIISAFLILLWIYRENHCDINECLSRIAMLEFENNYQHKRKHKIKIKRHADIPMPKITDNGDWCDLCASEDVELKEGEYKVIPLGISVELEYGYGAIIAPRSSTMKNFGIRMSNSIGIIDNSYCGEEDVWGFCAVADRNTVIRKGDRIAQFMIYQTTMHEAEIQEVSQLYNTNRGGYGSTGTRRHNGR